MPRVQRGKVSATFEAAGCGSLRLLRALRGTRILQAAAPTLVTPKLLGSIQKIQAAALEDFLCSADLKSLARRNVRATACFYADVNAPAGSQRQHMPFTVTAFPVKMRLERPAGRDKRKYKIIFPLKMPRATRRAF